MRCFLTSTRNIDVKKHLIFPFWKIYMCTRALQRCPFQPLCLATHWATCLISRSLKSYPNFTNEVFFGLYMNPCFWISPHFAYMDNEWILESLSKVLGLCSCLFLPLPLLVALDASYLGQIPCMRPFLTNLFITNVKNGIACCVKVLVLFKGAPYGSCEGASTSQMCSIWLLWGPFWGLPSGNFPGP